MVNLQCEHLTCNKISANTLILNSAPCTNAQDLPKAVFYNVGQGDMSLFISKTGVVLLTDCNLNAYSLKKFSSNIKESFEYKISQELKKHNLHHISCFVITHNHLDHYRGCNKLLERLNAKFSIVVDNILVPNSLYCHYCKTKNQNLKVNDIVNFISKYNSKVKVIEGSIKVKIKNSNDVLIYCYSPSFIDQIHYSKIDKNYNSIVTYIIEENCLYIFTGDAIVNKQKEYITDLFNNKLLKLPQNSIKIDKLVLKVSHHGSYTGTDDVLIKAIENYVNLINGDDEQNDNSKYLEISFISCGNQYGLPDENAVNCLIHSTFDNHASDSKNSRNRNNELKKTTKLHNSTPKLLNLTPDSYKIKKTEKLK